ncbi:sugar ABC transporter substrate-binding protein [Catellatospora sp. NPDC049609]|uniref:ABC transporter substrate-binding protein n=1 Tax=Catellatospora sp. NPDC049609 TaxID=3155505 RepID=UPI00343AFE84
MKARSMKAAAALAGAMVSMALVATGCSSADTPADKPAVTEITFWSWLRASQEVVDAFNKTHTDVQVKFEQVPGGPDGYGKFANAVKAGNAPDVMTAEYYMLPDMVSQGQLQDLTGSAGELVRSKFPAPVQSLVTLGGKTWSVPLDAGAMVMFYRKDLFDKYGIAVPKTWDEFRTAAERVKAANPKARIADWVKDDPSLLTSLSWQGGAKWFSVQGDAWKVDLSGGETSKVAAYWQDMLDKDLVAVVSPDEKTQKQKNSELLVTLTGAWGAGGLRGGLPDQAGKWASAPLPHWGTPASAMMGGSSFGVAKTSTKTEAALKFITWMNTTPEGIQARLSSGASSTLPAIPELAEVAKKNFDTAFFGGQDLYAVAGESAAAIVPGWTWGPAMGSTNAALREGYAQVGAGKAKLADVLGTAQGRTVDDLKSRGINVAQ